MLAELSDFYGRRGIDHTREKLDLLRAEAMAESVPPDTDGILRVAWEYFGVYQKQYAG